MILHNITVNVCAMVNGLTIPLRLLNGVHHWPLWQGGGVPLTCRHDVNDADSPFNNNSKFGSHVTTVTIHVSAEDQRGNIISPGFLYRNSSQLSMQKFGGRDKGAANEFPRVLHGAKFKDQVRSFKVENADGILEPVASQPCLCVNMDSFVRVVRCETPKVELGEEGGGMMGGVKDEE